MDGGSNHWFPLKQTKIDGEAFGDNFGFSVSLSADASTFIVVRAPFFMMENGYKFI
jgi:hypothetical protein